MHANIACALAGDSSYFIDDLKEVVMRPCLDCNSSWVSDDVCGDCGEHRLSKRSYKAWTLSADASRNVYSPALMGRLTRLTKR